MLYDACNGVNTGFFCPLIIVKIVIRKTWSRSVVFLVNDSVSVSLISSGSFIPIRDECGALEQTFSFKAFEIIIARYHVVKNVDTQDIPGIGKSPGQFKIVFRRFRFSRRVIVDKDH
jgi:hypothetical protein